MIVSRGCLNTASRLMANTLYAYHPQDLLRRPKSSRHTLIYLPASHLYIDRTLNGSFSEKKFIFVMQQQQKISTQIEILDRMFRLAEKNVQKIYLLKTCTTLLSTAYYLNYKETEILCRIGGRGLDIIKDGTIEMQYEFSYVITKFLIACSRLFGLRRFKNEYYQSIAIERLKPLFLIFILQQFWRENIHYNYAFTDKIVRVLEKYQKYLSFSDVHHLLMVKKVIKDPTFLTIAQNMQTKLKKLTQINQLQSDEKSLSPKLISTSFENYLNDLKYKYL